jgi:hypothetical protein
MMTRRTISRRTCNAYCPRRRECVYINRPNQPTGGAKSCPIIIAILKYRAAAGGMGSLRNHFRRAMREYGYLIHFRPEPFPPQI